MEKAPGYKSTTQMYCIDHVLHNVVITLYNWNDARDPSNTIEGMFDFSIGRLELEIASNRCSYCNFVNNYQHFNFFSSFWQKKLYMTGVKIRLKFQGPFGPYSKIDSLDFFYKYIWFVKPNFVSPHQILRAVSLRVQLIWTPGTRTGWLKLRTSSF